MSLFVPSSRGVEPPPHAQPGLAKGVLTNLDTSEWFSFQFNPVTFKAGRDINWGSIAWRGSELGGDRAYINSGPYEFDLNLTFVSDPAAPDVQADTVDLIPHPDYRVDFEAVVATIERWCTPQPGSLSPARINVAMGPARYFNGIILRFEYDITVFWGADLTAREATMKLEFQQWELTAHTQQ